MEDVGDIYYDYGDDFKRYTLLLDDKGGQTWYENVKLESAPNGIFQEEISMVSMLPQFVAIRYPGYFWNTANKSLYSIKIGGVLRKMTLTHPNRHNCLRGPAYYISVNGIRRIISFHELLVTPIKKSVIPME